jgi:predicted nucleic acid-binding protein
VFKLLPALNQVKILEQDYRDAGDKLAIMRQKGITVPSSDGLIAQVAIRESLVLIANDRHFEQFTEAGLKLVRLTQ